jgi:hypothetical protein
MFMKQYEKKHPNSYHDMYNKPFIGARVLLYLVIMFCLSISGFTQNRILVYTIKHNGSKIGSMCLQEIKDSNKLSLKLRSDVSTSFIFSFKVSVIEDAIYENGILLYSFINQKINGSEKVNNKIRLAGFNYSVTTNGRKGKPEELPITYNMICLYTREPENVTHIFSDRYRQYLPITKIDMHQYKIAFPGGDNNEYYYQNGICRKVKVTAAFYSAVMELN